MTRGEKWAAFAQRMNNGDDLPGLLAQPLPDSPLTLRQALADATHVLNTALTDAEDALRQAHTRPGWTPVGPHALLWTGQELLVETGPGTTTPVLRASRKVRVQAAHALPDLLHACRKE